MVQSGGGAPVRGGRASEAPGKTSVWPGAQAGQPWEDRITVGPSVFGVNGQGAGTGHSGVRASNEGSRQCGGSRGGFLGGAVPVQGCPFTGKAGHVCVSLAWGLQTLGVSSLWAPHGTSILSWCGRCARPVFALLCALW